MATIRPMRPDDLLKFSSTNLDHLTETYNIGFYLEYLTKWPELCQVIEGIDGQIEGYSTLPPQLFRANSLIATNSPR
jgi:N-terminal acetyltransferase B complex catalytic subunit